MTEPTKSSPKIINYDNLFSDFFSSAKNRKIQYLVLHHIEAKNHQQAILMLKEHKVSAHFLIDELGEVFALVKEEDIAYHSGYSFWRGEYSLNGSSIGIEFQNPSPFSQKFSEVQLKSGLFLAQYLIKKYKIPISNVVGHSDIAFTPENGFLDRKQDPSHLFDWQVFVKNGLAIGHISSSSKISSLESDDQKNLQELFVIGDADSQIAAIKKRLSSFGYLIRNFDQKFDEEMKYLVRVFNRRFLPESFSLKYGLDAWYNGSNQILQKLKF